MKNILQKAIAENKIQGITLDFWNTIAMDIHYARRFRARVETAFSWLNEHGSPVSFPTIDQAFRQFSILWMETWVNSHRTLASVDCVRFVLKTIDSQLSENQAAQLAKTIEEQVLLLPPVLLDYARESIQSLSARYKLALICDTGLSGPAMIDHFLKTWELLPLIKNRVYSLELGVSKPEAAIFQSALDQLALKPEQVVHIGDSERTDIVGAKVVGMYTVRLDAIDSDNHSIQSTQADKVVGSWKELIELLNYGI